MFLFPAEFSSVSPGFFQLSKHNLSGKGCCFHTFIAFFVCLEMDSKHLAEMPSIVPKHRSCDVPYGEGAGVRQFSVSYELLAAVQSW